MGNPSATSRPMLQTMLIIASIIRATERKRSLNIRYLTASMTIPAIGANIAMSLNISEPKVSLATGSPAT